jgi:heme oxygenase
VLQQVLRKLETDAADMKRKGMSFARFKKLHAMRSFKLGINCIL